MLQEPKVGLVKKKRQYSSNGCHYGDIRLKYLTHSWAQNWNKIGRSNSEAIYHFRIKYSTIHSLFSVMDFVGGPKWPKICRGPNLILRTGPPFAIQILSRLDMTIHQAPPSTYHPYLSKNLSKSRLSKSFLGFLGDFWGGEPYLYSEFSYFQNLSVFSNISAWHSASHCMQ